MAMTREEATKFLVDYPDKFGHMLGFTKLGTMHREWMRMMLRNKYDETLQASRGTYKTTCVSIVLALIIILLPNKRTMFMRKTDSDVTEVIKQVQKILQDPHTQYFVQCIYNVGLKFLVASKNEVSTNLSVDIKGTSQLIGIGTSSSLTGKHFDFVFTDDIVNIDDRRSKATREATKLVYQELQNIKNRGGKIFNTGTPWHAEDAFSLMPNAQKFDCYHESVRQIISEKELEDIKNKMAPSLFAANYELRFIASEEIIFSDPKMHGDPAMVEQGTMHVDSAFYGTDYTAWCIMKKQNDKYYVYGKMARKHVEDCYADINNDYIRFMCGKLYNESNADKGMVGKELRKFGMKVILYHEGMNKYVKIVTYLKAIWNDIIFVEGTDDGFIRQVCDYNEDAEHDDAPDSLASIARILYKKTPTDYTPLWN